MTDYKFFVRPEDVPPFSPPGHSGTVNRRLIGEDVVGAKNLEVVLGELEVGGAAHPHKHEDLEHAYYVLDGKCEIKVGEEIRIVTVGTMIFVPKNTEHYIKVLEKLRLLVFYAPPKYHPGE